MTSTKLSAITVSRMDIYSTRMAAKKLGLHFVTLQRYIAANKIPAPKSTRVGGSVVRAWTEDDIERVRKVLPTIKNGRKTRYSKLRKKRKTAQPRAAVPHKSRKPRKK